MEIEQGPVAVGADEPLWRYVRLSTLFLYLSGRAYIPSIKALQERDLIYAKPEITDADGMRLGELEGIVADEDGYTAESDAAFDAELRSMMGAEGKLRL